MSETLLPTAMNWRCWRVTIHTAVTYLRWRVPPPWPPPRSLRHRDFRSSESACCSGICMALSDRLHPASLATRPKGSNRAYPSHQCAYTCRPYAAVRYLCTLGFSSHVRRWLGGRALRNLAVHFFPRSLSNAAMWPKWRRSEVPPEISRTTAISPKEEVPLRLPIEPRLGIPLLLLDLVMPRPCI